jgi:RecA/RadA recombinase
MKKSSPELLPGFHTADQVLRQRLHTGIQALDELLEGGLESGLTHLFYGDRSLHRDLLKIAVQAQLPLGKKGINSPTIIIDSANIMRIEDLTDYAFEAGLEPEEVMDRIYISRAFNSSQTYDLVMNQLDTFFDRVPARLLMVTGLPDLYFSEGITSEGSQQITHMAAKIMSLTLNRDIFTVVSTRPSEGRKDLPAGGRALAGYTQIHVQVTEAKSYFMYTLAKHPQFAVRRVSRPKPVTFGTTLPLSYFLNQDEEE